MLTYTKTNSVSSECSLHCLNFYGYPFHIELSKYFIYIFFSSSTSLLNAAGNIREVLLLTTNLLLLCRHTNILGIVLESLMIEANNRRLRNGKEERYFLKKGKEGRLNIEIHKKRMSIELPLEIAESM